MPTSASSVGLVGEKMRCSVPMPGVTRSVIMSKVSRGEGLKILGMVSEIAAEAAGNQNIVWMIEFQEELVTRLYGKFCELLSSSDFEGKRRTGRKKRKRKKRRKKRRKQQNEDDDVSDLSGRSRCPGSCFKP